MEENMKLKNEIKGLFHDKKNVITTSIILGLALIVFIASSVIFISFKKFTTYFNTTGVTEIQHLKDYSPNLNGAGGEAEIFVLKGPDAIDADPKTCPSVLILGGTHPNEPSGQLTATLLLENLKVKGNTIVYIMTETNKSAFTYSYPQEGTTLYYHLLNRNGVERTFKFGTRATNSTDQWPTPDIYTTQSGAKLSSTDTRNLNRAYPGLKNGTYSEKVAYGIVELIKQNDIKVVFDLHEASPEYVTINAIVYHEDASKIASAAVIELDSADITITPNVSPTNLRGLSHREIGDATDALVFLAETSNAAQGKIRGAFTEDLITYSSKDKFYEAAVKIGEETGNKIIYGAPVPIGVRVARHTSTVMSILNQYNKEVAKSKSGFDNLDADRKAFLQECGKIQLELDLYSLLNDKSGYDADEKGTLAQNYKLLVEKGVGYFLAD